MATSEVQERLNRVGLRLLGLEARLSRLTDEDVAASDEYSSRAAMLRDVRSLLEEVDELETRIRAAGNVT